MAGTIEHRGGPARRDLLRGALLGSGLGSGGRVGGADRLQPPRRGGQARGQ